MGSTLIQRNIPELFSKSTDGATNNPIAGLHTASAMVTLSHNGPFWCSQSGHRPAIVFFNSLVYSIVSNKIQIDWGRSCQGGTISYKCEISDFYFTFIDVVREDYEIV